jgi:hypothetical protein
LNNARARLTTNLAAFAGYRKDVSQHPMSDDLRIRNRKPAIIIAVGVLVFGLLAFAVQYPNYKRAKEDARRLQLKSIGAASDQ